MGIYKDNSIKEQIRRKIEEIRKDYDYNFNGTRTESFVVSTHDGFQCNLSVEIMRGAKVLVEPKFGYLEIEGDIIKESSSERDMQIIKEFDTAVWSYRQGVTEAVERLIGVENPDYDEDSFSFKKLHNTKYINNAEIRDKVEEIFDSSYSIKYEDEYKERRFKDYALREYVLRDMEVSFCKELKVVIPINYKK